jgi:hypothetical protein
MRIKFRELFGEESKSSNKQFLFRRIAWRMQANAEGELSERARRRVGEIVNEADLRTRAPKGFLAESVSGAEWEVERSQRQRDWRLPAPGTLITRRHENRQIVVKVLRDGFEYESRQYRSLSAIAREVTGTRWNGLLFFGLTERRSFRNRLERFFIDKETVKAHRSRSFLNLLAEFERKSRRQRAAVPPTEFDQIVPNSRPLPPLRTSSNGQD